MTSVFVRPAIHTERSGAVDGRRRERLAEEQTGRVDIQLVDIDGVRWVHAFPHREPNLIPLRDDDLRAAARCVVLVVVVTDRCLSCCGLSYTQRDEERRNGKSDSQTSAHVPYTISADSRPAASSAIIPKVARATSPIGRAGLRR